MACGGAATSIASLITTICGRSPRSVCQTTMPEATAWRSIQPKSGSGSSPASRVANSRKGRRATARHDRTTLQDEANGISARRSRGFGYDRIAQHADTADLDLHVVARLHPQGRCAARAHSARRARHDHVAGQELRPRRAVLDQLRDVETKLADTLVLHDLAVQARRERERAWIGQLVARHEPRTERAAVVKVLAGRELLRVPLEVANAAVVEARVTRDVVECLLLADA